MVLRWKSRSSLVFLHKAESNRYRENILGLKILDKELVDKSYEHEDGFVIANICIGADIQLYIDLIDGGGNPDMNNGTSGYSINSPQMMSGQHGNVNLPPLFETDVATSAMAYPGMDSRFGLDSPNMSKLGSQMTGNALQASYMDPMYLQYLRPTEYAAAAAQLAGVE
ncbi:pumilio homolog 2-like protein [Tanacetum coccineum]